MSEHTPGPWKLDLRSGCLAVYPANETYNCLAEAHHWAIHYAGGRSIYDEDDNFVRHEMDAEVVANAHLIAAAPELYEALRAIQAGFIDGSIRFVKTRLSDSDPYHPANILMTTALAKATVTKAEVGR